MNIEYREQLVKTVDYLIEVRHILFNNSLNLAMKNDLKEIDEVFDIGETYVFSLNHLDNSSDINLQKVVDLIKNIEKTVDSLININVIKDEELTNER
jgi:hypothetical protein